MRVFVLCKPSCCTAKCKVQIIRIYTNVCVHLKYSRYEEMVLIVSVETKLYLKIHKADRKYALEYVNFALQFRRQGI